MQLVQVCCLHRPTYWHHLFVGMVEAATSRIEEAGGTIVLNEGPIEAGNVEWDGRCVVGGDGGVCVFFFFGLNPDEVNFFPPSSFFPPS